MSNGIAHVIRSPVEDILVDGYADADAWGSTVVSSLALVDVTDPTHPTLVAEVASSDGAFGCRGADSAGTLTFLADGNEGLHIFDTSDVASPALLGATRLFASRVYVDGARAVVAAGWEGIKVLDVSDVSAPRLVGQTPSAWNAWVEDLLVHGTHVYVANGGDHRNDMDGRFHVVDISREDSPSIVGTLSGLSNPWALALRDEHVFVSDDWNGLAVIDVSNPSSPQMTQTIPIPGRSFGIALMDSYAVVANSERGLVFVDISDLSQIGIAGEVQTDGKTYGVTVMDGRIYASNTRGVRIFHAE